MAKKKILGTKNVYELAQERLKVIFNEFDNIYVSFSGGKDSGVLLNMCIDYIRKNNLKIRLGVFHMDYEIQYKMTIDYVDRMLEANKDILDVYRVCIPFRVATCTSMYQSFWRPWEDSKKNIWVRSMPKKIFLFIIQPCGIMNFRCVLRNGYIIKMMQCALVV